MNAALCKLENEAMSALQKLAFNTSAWNVICASHRSVSFRNHQAQLISTFACRNKQIHSNIRLNFPWMTLLRLISSVHLDVQCNGIICKDRLEHRFKG